MSVVKNLIEQNHTRNNLLTDFGKQRLKDDYLLVGETFQGLFARVAAAYADDQEHAQRLYEYMSNLWFMPATPVLSNGGAGRGLPISCFLNEVEDTLESIIALENENFWLSAKGGGIGSYWGNVRSIGEGVKNAGKSGGIIPWIVVGNAYSLAVSQGTLRPGSRSYYLPIWHPEIEEFLAVRKPAGDPNRKAFNVHHGVVIDDVFMEAVKSDSLYNLRSPKDDSTVGVVKARDLWVKLLTTRLETGEPYLLFIDNVNRSLPVNHQLLDLKVKTSNLCSEITLPTGRDHRGNERTGVCCLSSVNLEYFDQWSINPLFIEDVMKFLDNVLQDFIDRAPDGLEKAKYSAIRERSVGLGVMGFHSYLQSKMIPFESVLARSTNMRIFNHIGEATRMANIKLAHERGACPDAMDAGTQQRFTNTTAIAPTASISVIAGNSSPGIEPYSANSFTQKSKSGSFVVRNKHLDALIKHKLENVFVPVTDQSPVYVSREHEYSAIWSAIARNEGSIQNLDFFSDDEKAVFKTAAEIDQTWIVHMAADRQPFITQAQSVNIWLAPDVHKRYLSDLHFLAWKLGLKSLYYCRSSSIQRAEKPINFNECMGCQ